MLNNDQTQALELLNSYEKNNSTAPAFKNILKKNFISNLKERIRNPELIDQGSLNACGPAAFFTLLCRDNPVALTSLAIDIYQKGEASIGSLNIKPNKNILVRFPGDKLWPSNTSINDPVDWMLLTSLRDSENPGIYPDFDDPNDVVTGITLPAELEHWLMQQYKTVKNEILLTGRNVHHLIGSVNKHFLSGYRCILLINADMIYSTSKWEHIKNKNFKALGSSIVPNHYIVYSGDLDLGDNNIEFNAWSWGCTLPIKISPILFNQQYYGAIFAKQTTKF